MTVISGVVLIKGGWVETYTLFVAIIIATNYNVYLSKNSGNRLKEHHLRVIIVTRFGKTNHLCTSGMHFIAPYHKIHSYTIKTQ